MIADNINMHCKFLKVPITEIINGITILTLYPFSFGLNLLQLYLNSYPSATKKYYAKIMI